MEYHLTVAKARERLRAAVPGRSGSEQAGPEQCGPAQCSELLQLGSLTVRFYAPRVVDRQQPHTRDEVYVVASGAATFRCCEKEVRVEQGDVLTVPAFQSHVFVDLTADFATWVFFYGPEGGERTTTACCSDAAPALTLIGPATAGAAGSQGSAQDPPRASYATSGIEEGEFLPQ